jgi:peptidyl-prolyl cis-trans isomerase SurA
MRNIRMHQLKLAAVLLCTLAAGQAMAQAPAAAKPGGFLPPAAAAANVIDSIAVVVNDDVITKNELAARVRMIEARMKASNAPLPDAADLQRQVLEAMIVERAQQQLAREMGVKVDDQTLDRAIARIAEQQKMSLQEMRNQMEKEGMTYAAFREEIRNEIMMTRLREHEVDNKIQISDAEVDTYMAAEKAAVADQVELNISQILVRIPENASSEQIAARKARADEVARQLRTGADFAKTAATYSDAPDALKGGEIGWRDPNRLPPLFAEQLAKLAPGQVTPVIRSNTGFHLIKLVDKRKPQASAETAAAQQQTHARHILLKVTPTVTAADAKRKLAELKERLDNKAARFEDLARSFSTDAAASKGGDLGWLYPGDAVPEFETAMNALKPGEVSGVVETPFGFHRIEVVGRKSDDSSKERERNAARQVIRERKVRKQPKTGRAGARPRLRREFREINNSMRMIGASATRAPPPRRRRSVPPASRPASAEISLRAAWAMRRESAACCWRRRLPGDDCQPARPRAPDRRAAGHGAAQQRPAAVRPGPAVRDRRAARRACGSRPARSGQRPRRAGHARPRGRRHPGRLVRGDGHRAAAKEHHQRRRRGVFRRTEY